MKKPKRIKEVYFLWYHEEYDCLFELGRDTTNEMVLMKAMNNFCDISHKLVLIGLIEVKYK